ncbi:MAG: hypothetical protein JO247_18635, partial [Chloroflexi bacterium]|nr:hypothetical protein [Chloroflexota bacterium]
LADVLALQGGAATARVLSGASLQSRLTKVQQYYAANTPLYPVVDGIVGAISTFQNSAGTSLINDFVTRASNTVQQMANADTPLAQVTLSNALSLLISQMIGSSDSINSSSVSIGAQTAVGSPSGNPVIVVSDYTPAGLIYQTVLPETLTWTCTADSQSGTATAGQEPLAVSGAAALANWAYNWPGGSGLSTSLNCVDASVDSAGGASGNLLTNGDFETFTNTNVPDNWVLLVGTAGTNVAREAVPYTGSYSLGLLGDGSTLPAVYQPFNTAKSTVLNNGGTPSRLQPSSLYAFNLWYKLSIASPSAGVLQVSLTDGSNAIVNDQAGNANAFTVSLPGVGNTSWHALSGVIRTPAVLPAQLRLRVRQSTALDNSNIVYVDRLALTPLSTLYKGGLSAAAFSGSNKLIKGDSWTFAVTNTMGVFAAYLERAFGLRNLGLQIPYSGSPTIADSLVA